MRNLVILALIFSLLSACSSNPENTQNEIPIMDVKALTELVSETTGLKHAESAVYDSKNDVIYVSVQRDDVEGDGSIATLSPTGELLDENFVNGLNEPKGLQIVGEMLYASDVTNLVEIDLLKKEITNRYTIEGAEFMNDVTADAEGNVYVSDMHRSAIYRLDLEKNLDIWHKSPEMENPNGLLVDGNTVFLAAWGQYTNGVPKEADIGRLLAIDMNTKTITKITKDKLGHLDGIQLTADRSAFYVSDWMSGEIFMVTKEGDVSSMAQLPPSVGDILFLDGQIICPMKKPGSVIFLKVL